MMCRIFIFLFVIVFQVYAPSFGQSNPKREMRAVWIATVNNIDWPSKSGLPTEDQQRELVELLEMAKTYHLNTIILQVRPATDAFYPSSLEPWSQWLTGTQGQAPNPLYDPLAFAIDECRKRGLDIHLWLNPYRAQMDTAKQSLAGTHPARIHPEWFVTYGRTRYFNPGLQQTRDHVTRVVADLVRRYDVDAIHMDDYFYPYRIAGMEFPDSAAFASDPRGFAPEQKDDWRRDNVDQIIKQIHDTITSIKPHVEFGISPFGVWRNADKDPTGSNTRAGVTNYDDLYADVLKWQKLGWIDYVTPQLYWHIGMEAADYATLAEWWSHNTYGCRLYIGQAWYRIDPDSKTPSWQSSEEIIRQISLNRQYPTIGGSMYFSAKSLRANPLQLKEKLLANHYKTVALPPRNYKNARITSEMPRSATVSKKGRVVSLSWEKPGNSKYFVVYKFGKKEVLNIQNPEKMMVVSGETTIRMEKSRENNPRRFVYVVSAIDLWNHESEGVVLERR